MLSIIGTYLLHGFVYGSLIFTAWGLIVLLIRELRARAAKRRQLLINQLTEEYRRNMNQLGSYIADAIAQSDIEYPDSRETAELKDGLLDVHFVKNEEEK